MATGGFNNLLWFFGVVEDRNDPQRLGRVRVRVIDMHPSDKSKVATEDLPWAVPSIGTFDTNYKPPLEGSWVLGFFVDGQDGQHPVIVGLIPGMTTSIVDPSKGFNAAHDLFPLPTDLYQPDLPRLARAENIEETSVVDKYIDNEDGQPDPPYNAVYPYNKVHQTESGHIIELDDTPGAERINIEHRTGTYTEVAPNGSLINKIVGEMYTVVECDGKIHIKGTANVDVDGHCTINVKGNCELNVDGTLDQNIHGDYNLNVGGEININAGDIIRARGTGIRLESLIDSINVYAKRRVLIESKNDLILNSNTGSVGIFGGTDVRTRAGQTIFNHSGGSTHNYAGGSHNTEALGNIEIGTDNSVSFDPSSPPLGATPAKRTLLSTPINRKFVIVNTKSPPPYGKFTDQKTNTDQHDLDIAENAR